MKFRCSQWERGEIEAAAESMGIAKCSAFLLETVMARAHEINDRSGANLAAIALGAREIHEAEDANGEEV
jgi:hypothetical protein